MTGVSHPTVGVGGVVILDGRVVLVRRGKEPLRGRWVIPGGTVEAGETLEDALVRDQAKQRAAVAHSVRLAIYVAQTDALLHLRDSGAINDKVHQELQLDLDRANAAKAV